MEDSLIFSFLIVYVVEKSLAVGTCEAAFFWEVRRGIKKPAPTGRAGEINMDCYILSSILLLSRSYAIAIAFADCDKTPNLLTPIGFIWLGVIVNFGV